MSEYIEYGFQSPNSLQSHRYLFPVVKKLLTDKRKKILDFGCGNGSMAVELLKLGYDVYGVDASTEGIRIAKKQFPERFYIFNLYKDEFPRELNNIKFEVIISTEVIEHIVLPRQLISFCKEIFKKNNDKGEIIISTPYHGYFKNLALAISGRMDSHFTVLWDGGHIKFWSKKTLFNLLKEFEFEEFEFRGCGRFPLFWKSMIVKGICK
jgi:2-polyprenyl-3-methyl-5-hydroxy-6-metoxy-1,4-benzoquinol methylase